MAGAMRITVIVTDAEYAEIKRLAGLVPLSTWIKARCLEYGIEISDDQDAARTRELPLVPRRNLAVAPSTPSVADDDRSGDPESDRNASTARAPVPVDSRGVAELVDAPAPWKEGTPSDRPVGNTLHAGSNPAPATKERTLDFPDDSIEAAVASRVGHHAGCQCFNCLQTYRFIDQQRKSAEKKEEKPARNAKPAKRERR